jgi:hypothetical protein
LPAPSGGKDRPIFRSRAGTAGLGSNVAIFMPEAVLRALSFKILNILSYWFETAARLNRMHQLRAQFLGGII